MEGINSGLVEVKFRESAKSVKATQVSVKTTMYSFKHERMYKSLFSSFICNLYMTKKMSNRRICELYKCAM